MPSLTGVTDQLRLGQNRTSGRSGRESGAYLKCTPYPRGSEVMATFPGENSYRVRWSLLMPLQEVIP